jgi:ABC-type glycerol-3-phosphate transport system substrate-binding protein
MVSVSAFKVRSAALAVATALATGVAACGSSGPADSASGEVHVWALQDAAQQKFQEPAVEAFNKASKTDAKLETFQNNVYTDKLRVAMGSPNAPDVFFNWGGGSIATYVENGQLADLTPFLEENPDLKDAFLPSVLDAGKIDGKYYGVPLRGMQPVLLFYNEAVFEKIGAEPPKTWDDVEALVPKLKGEGITPFALGAADAWTDLMWLEYLTDRIGGQQPFLNILEGKPGAWSDPAITRALTEIRSLIDSGGFGTKYNSVGYGNAQASTLLAQGKAAMHLMGTWEYTNQLDQQEEFAKQDLGYTTFPIVEGGEGDPAAVVGNPTNYFSVNQKSKNRDAATEFLKQMSTDGYVRDLIAGGDVPAIQGIEDELRKAPNAQFSLDVYDMVQKAPTFTLSWDQAVDSKESQAMIENLQRFFAKQIGVKEFQQNMERAAA